MSLYTDYKTDVHKKFQIAFPYDFYLVQYFVLSATVRFRVMLMADSLSLSHTHAHRPSAKNVIMKFREPENVQFHQKPNIEKLTPKTILSLSYKDKKKGGEERGYKKFSFVKNSLDTLSLFKVKFKREILIIRLNFTARLVHTT